jgi:hypothetical protein
MKTVLVDCRKLGRIEACDLAKRLSKSEPGLRLVALVDPSELSVGWMLGFDDVLTSVAALDAVLENPHA